MPAPPEIGRLLPRAASAIGIEEKLLRYSLNPRGPVANSKTRGFGIILGIRDENVEYLEGAIQTGILIAPISSIKVRPPWGLNCVVEIPVRGIGQGQARTVSVRTVWRITDDHAPLRLLTAFVKT